MCVDNLLKRHLILSMKQNFFTLENRNIENVSDTGIRTKIYENLTLY